MTACNCTGPVFDGKCACQLKTSSADDPNDTRRFMAPIPMILFCPACGTQHIDTADQPKPDLVDPSGVWTNPPHRSHLCEACAHVWRPADVPTTGVAEITTRGEADTSPAIRGWMPAVDNEAVGR